MTCTTQPPSEPRDDRPGGPTPRGEYLIGNRYTHQSHGIDWYRLYPKKEDNSGYYGYLQRTKKGRFAMGLHPGTESLGCVTVYAPSYDDDSCWQRIRRVIDSGNMYYRGSSYKGFLYVKIMWQLWPKVGFHYDISARFEASPTVSGHESYVYFDPLFWFWILIDTVVSLRMSARLDKNLLYCNGFVKIHVRYRATTLTCHQIIVLCEQASGMHPY